MSSEECCVEQSLFSQSVNPNVPDCTTSIGHSKRGAGAVFAAMEISDNYEGLCLLSMSTSLLVLQPTY